MGAASQPSRRQRLPQQQRGVKAAPRHRGPSRRLQRQNSGKSPPAGASSVTAARIQRWAPRGPSRHPLTARTVHLRPCLLRGHREGAPKTFPETTLPSRSERAQSTGRAGPHAGEAPAARRGGCRGLGLTETLVHAVLRRTGTGATRPEDGTARGRGGLCVLHALLCCAPCSAIVPGSGPLLCKAL